MADESEDISTQEEFSICCRWIVDGQPEEPFMSILHVIACDAETIADKLESFVTTNGLEYSKMVGPDYDSTAVFSGVNTGVQARMECIHLMHYTFHCACHRLQLASTQAADCVPEIKKVFGLIENFWKFFYYSPKKTEALKEGKLHMDLCS